MLVYVIVNFTLEKVEKLKIYNAGINQTLIEFCGEFIAKGPVDLLNGLSSFEMQIIIAFPSRIMALGWYNSPNYQALVPLRDEGMDSQFQLVG